MTTYQWHLKVEETARKQLSKLSSQERMAVFRLIAELCAADDSYILPNVMKLREKRFEGIYRRRQGNYRIFFLAEPGEVEVHKHVYKGILQVLRILHRKDAYR